MTTSTNKATAYTAQLTFNLYTRALLDYERTEFDTRVVANGQSLDREDAVMMRFQVDF